MKRRILSMLLAGTMVAGMLTGCQKADDADKKNDDKQENVDNTDKDKEDKSREITTLKILCANEFSADITMENWEDSRFSQQFISDLEEIGLRVEIEPIANENLGQVIQTRMAAGQDMPDLIAPRGTVDVSDVSKWGENGLIYALDDLIEQYDEDGSILKFIEEVVPGSWNAQKSSNTGEHYWFYGLTGIGAYQQVYQGETIYNTWPYSVSVRKDWIEKAGEEVKEVYTPDEFIDLMMKLRNNDANGNGVADEVVYFKASGAQSVLPAFGLNTNLIYGYYGNGNEIFCDIYQENYPAYIEFMNTLYEKGLWDSVALDMSMDEMLSSDRVAAVHYYSNWDFEASVPGAEENGVEYVPIYLELDGDIDNGVNLMIDPLTPVAESVYMNFIPKSCENVEAVIKLFDYIYSDKYALLCQYGIEGFSYDFDEDGNVVARSDFEDRLAGFNSGSLSGFAIPPVHKFPVVQENGFMGWCSKDYLEADYEWIQNFSINQYENPGNQFIVSVPDYAIATDEETAKVDEIGEVLNTYINELNMDLILGKKSLDDLSTYQKELENLGIQDYLDIRQARRDRYLSVE